MQRATRFIATCLFTCLVLAACGGGSKRSTPAVTPPPPPPSADASLAGLGVSTGDLDQVFQSGVNDYSATTSYLGAATTVTATANDANASVSINGATAVAGEANEAVVLGDGPNLVTITVTAEDGVSSDSYSLDVTRADATGLAHLEYIKASNPDVGDRFGNAVAFSGDTFAVATTAEDSAATVVNGDSLDNNAPGAGAVYVFRKDVGGSWAEEAYVKASNASGGDEFGYSIALSGDTLAIGASREDSAATGIGGDETDNSAVDAGAVYIFVRDDTGVWSQQAYIKASNAQAFDGFGAAVALTGDTLAVSADLEDSAATGIDGDQANNGGSDSGAVYVFTRDTDGNWAQQAYLKASNTDANDRFGNAIALSRDTLVVGALREDSRATDIDGDQDSNNSADAGAAYVFARDVTGAWTQQAYVKASNTDRGDSFGASLSLSNDTLVVGAPREDSAAIGVDGFENDNKALNAGAAYVFVRDGAGAWSQQGYLKASNTGSQDQFGHAVANYGEFLAVAALEDSIATDINGEETSNAATNSGAVYLFVRDGTWGQAGYVKAVNTGTGDSFGASLAFADAALLISADQEDSMAVGIGGDTTDDSTADAGAAYLIR